jgi:hypothetical protein
MQNRTAFFSSFLEAMRGAEDQLQYLPLDEVELVAHNDGIKDHIPQKISYGFIESKHGRIEVFAYLMSTHTGTHNLPDIHFYGRRFDGRLKRYHHPDLARHGWLYSPFDVIKDMPGEYPAIVLLHVSLTNRGIYNVELTASSTSSWQRAPSTLSDARSPPRSSRIFASLACTSSEMLRRSLL